MGWTVLFRRKAAKQLSKLPLEVQDTVQLLQTELATEGPMQPEWPHFGKLSGKGEMYHCHVKNGRPTIVVCWEVQDKRVQILEIYYVGTHADAPY